MSVRLIAAVALVIAGFAALVAVLVPAGVGTRSVAVEERAAVVHAAPPVDPFLAALMPSTEVEPARAEELLLAADRVCEGFTAEVPVAVMSTTLAAELGLTGTEARTFVNVAEEVHCAPRV